MLNKRKITNMYMIEGICNKCGGKLVSTNVVLTSYPAKYPYKCENPNCDGYEVFEENDRPGKIIYECEDVFVYKGELNWDKQLFTTKNDIIISYEEGNKDV